MEIIIKSKDIAIQKHYTIYHISQQIIMFGRLLFIENHTS